jgi:hypothetical protein
MNRIEQINKELKIIRECVKAYKFLKGIEANGGDSRNAFISWSNRMHDCLTLDSTIENQETLLIYRKKIERERAALRTKENRVLFSKWLDKPNAKKFIKVLSKYGKNQTEAFNQFIKDL